MSGPRRCSRSRPWARVCVPVNVLLRAEELAHLIDDSGSTALVVDSARRAPAGRRREPPRDGRARRRRCPCPAAATAHDLEALIAGSPAAVPPGPGLRRPLRPLLQLRHHRPPQGGRAHARRRPLELHTSGARPAPDRRGPLPGASVAVVGGRLQRPRARPACTSAAAPRCCRPAGWAWIGSPPPSRPRAPRTRCSCPTLLKQLLSRPAELERIRRTQPSLDRLRRRAGAAHRHRRRSQAALPELRDRAGLRHVGVPDDRRRSCSPRTPSATPARPAGRARSPRWRSSSTTARSPTPARGRSCCARRRRWSATTTAPRRPPRRSPTAGSTRATSGGSTSTATSRSPAARRT